MKSAQKRKTYLISIDESKGKRTIWDDYEDFYNDGLIRLDSVTEEYKTAYVDALIEVFGESAVEINEIKVINPL